MSIKIRCVWFQNVCLKPNTRDFPRGPVLKILSFNEGGAGSIPGRGANIPHASGPKKTQNIKQKQHCNKFTKDFKNGPHKNNLKNIFKLKKKNWTLLRCLHSRLLLMKVKSESEVTQSCPTLSDPMDCSLPGCSLHGIFQARVLEWVAIAFSLDYPPLNNSLPRASAKLMSEGTQKKLLLWAMDKVTWEEGRQVCRLGTSQSGM